MQRHGLIALLTIAWALVFSCNANATEAENPAIQITPAQQKIQLSPGETYTGSFSVQNVGDKTFDYNIVVVPYQVIDESYSPNFSTSNNYTKITEWITLETDQKTIAPGKYDIINYTINVPKNAPVGGQYASVMAYTSGNDTGDGSFQIVSRVGTLLYAQVLGNVVTSGSVNANTVNQFSFSPPIFAHVYLKNTGNVDVDAKISLTVSSLFSNKILYDNTDKPASVTVLPETTRFATSTWEETPFIGIFRVMQAVEFAGNISTVERFVIVCPFWLAIMIIIILVLSILLLIVKISDRRKIKQNSCTF